MKSTLQYLNDINGNTQAVQLPLTDWEKVLNKIKKYEQALNLKSEFYYKNVSDPEALVEVEPIKLREWNGRD